MKKILSFLKTQAFYYTQQAKAQKAINQLHPIEYLLYKMLEKDIRKRGPYKGVDGEIMMDVMNMVWTEPRRFSHHFDQLFWMLIDWAKQAPGTLVKTIDWKTVGTLREWQGLPIQFTNPDPFLEQLGEEHAVRMQKDYMYN